MVFQVGIIHIVHQGAVYSGDLKPVLVWISNDQKEVGLQIVRILNEN